MKIEKKYLYKAYRNAMLEQLTEKLEAEGYVIEANNMYFDLLAKKDEKRIAYELKFRRYMIDNEKFNLFLDKAEEMDVEPRVIYMSLPDEKEIEFDGLELSILNYFTNNPPEEIDSLSTHTRVTDVYIERINSIGIHEQTISLSADATLTVELQFGSDREQEVGDTKYESLDMSFACEVNYDQDEYEVDSDSMEYDIDVEMVF